MADLSTTLTNWFNPAPTAATQGQAQTMGAIGNMMTLAGAIQGIVGTYYSSKTQKYQLESQKLSFQYKQAMSEINARQMENQAQAILLQGERQIGQVTLRAGKIKGATRASQAARGIVAGVGSAAEEIATIDLMKETDALTINANAVRAAGAARMSAVGMSNEALMAQLSAENAGIAAGQVSPFGNALSSMVTAAGSVASSWYSNNRLARLEAALGTAK